MTPEQLLAGLQEEVRGLSETVQRLSLTQWNFESSTWKQVFAQNARQHNGTETPLSIPFSSSLFLPYSLQFPLNVCVFTLSRPPNGRCRTSVTNIIIGPTDVFRTLGLNSFLVPRTKTDIRLQRRVRQPAYGRPTTQERGDARDSCWSWF